TNGDARVFDPSAYLAPIPEWLTLAPIPEWLTPVATRSQGRDRRTRSGSSACRAYGRTWAQPRRRRDRTASTTAAASAARTTAPTTMISRLRVLLPPDFFFGSGVPAIAASRLTGPIEAFMSS